MESSKRMGIAPDPIILIVPPELENEEAMLFCYRQMQMPPAPE